MLSMFFIALSVRIQALRNPVLLMSWLQGFSCGLPLALTGSTLSFLLSTEKVPLAIIGLFAFVALPYAFKFLWAPVIDLVKLPFFRKQFPTSPHLLWALLAQIGLIGSLIAMGFLIQFVIKASEGRDFFLLLLAIFGFLTSFFASTQDITLNAIRLSFVKDKTLGKSTAAYVFGYRLGMLVSGAGAIALSVCLSWPWIYYGMAFVVTCLTSLTLLLLKTPLSKDYLIKNRAPLNSKRAILLPFKEFINRPQALWIILFILCYLLGDCLLAQVAPAYLLELNYTKLEIASAVKFFGWGMTITGGFLGGWLIDRRGILRSLSLCGFLHMIANGGFLVLGLLEHHVLLLYGSFALIDLSGGMTMVAFVTYFGKLCHPTYRATQYALCTSLMAVPRAIFASASGVLVIHLGWFSFYLLCMSLAIPGILISCYLHSKQKRDSP